MRDWAAPPQSRLIISASLDQAQLDGAANAYIHFGLVGLSSLIDTIPYGSREFAFFERVSAPPTFDVIYRAIQDQSLANTLIRYAPHVSFQLAVAADMGTESASALALRIINALRVKTRADLLVPAHLSISWNELQKAIPGSCSGRILEDIPSAMTLEEPRNVEQVDFDWLWHSGEIFEELLRDGRFGLAVESLCYCHLLRDARMMAAGLWAGIEALCGVTYELRFRIALIASAILEPRGERRKALFKRLQQLYNVRSKAVHGAEVTTDALVEHVVEVRILLAQLIMKSITAGRILTTEDCEDLILL